MLSFILFLIIALEFLMFPRFKFINAYIRLVDLAILAAFTWCVGNVISEKRYKKITLSNIMNEWFYIWGVLIFAWVISVVFSQDFSTSFKELIQRLEYAFISFFSYWAIRRGIKIRPILSFIFSVTVIESIFGFYQYVTNTGDVMLTERLVRISGTLHNALASYLLVGVIIGIILTTPNSRKTKYLYLLGTGAILTALWLVQVRTILILFLFSSMLFIFLFKKNRLLFMKNLIFMLIIAVSFSFLIDFIRVKIVKPEIVKPEIIESLEYRGLATGKVRLELWKSALNMWKEHPLAGVGLGNYGYLFLKETYTTPYLSEVAKPLRLSQEIDAHSFIFTNLAEMGFVGLIAFGLFYFVLLKRSFKLVFSRSDFVESHIKALITIIVISILGSSISNPLGGKFFWVFAGFLMAMETRSRFHEENQPRR